METSEVTFEDRAVATRIVETRKVMERIQGAAPTRRPFSEQLATPTMLVVLLEQLTVMGNAHPWSVKDWWVMGRSQKANGKPGERVVKWTPGVIDNETPYWERVTKIEADARA